MTSHSLRFWITLRRPGSHAASERERNKKKTIIFSTNKKKTMPPRVTLEKMRNWRAFSPYRMKCSVKLLKGEIWVPLNLKDTVITEPELSAGDVLWDLIKAKREEQVIRIG